MEKRSSKDRLLAPDGAWTCPFCQQTVRVGAYGCCPPPDFVGNCLLREHMVGGQCIAYLNPRKARELMMERN